MADCRMEKPWGGFLCLFSSKPLHISARRGLLRKEKEYDSPKKRKKVRYCSASLCGGSKVMQRPDSGSPEFYKKRSFRASSSNSVVDSSITTRSIKYPVYKLKGGGGSPFSTSFSSSSSSSFSSSSFSVPYIPAINGGSGSLGAYPPRKFPGCYECKTEMDPVLGYTKDPSLRSSIFPCSMCGGIFMKSENLELHQSTCHAVSELDPEDTSRKIVEIIFKSSWMKKEPPTYKVQRILKVHNTRKTISKFEEHRDAIKAKATKKHPRCLADGNEQLRFHCTTIACSLGANGSTKLCHATHPPCSICTIIREGFKVEEKGILMTATSGAADDRASEAVEGNEERAMVVCRVVAGRVKRSVEAGMEDYDSVSGGVGVYSSLEELYVLNPMVILPCFVVIYEGLNA